MSCSFPCHGNTASNPCHVAESKEDRSSRLAYTKMGSTRTRKILHSLNQSTAVKSAYRICNSFKTSDIYLSKYKLTEYMYSLFEYFIRGFAYTWLLERWLFKF